MEKIAYSITHSPTQLPSLFDAPGTEAFASEQHALNEIPSSSKSSWKSCSSCRSLFLARDASVRTNRRALAIVNV